MAIIIIGIIIAAFIRGYQKEKERNRRNRKPNQADIGAYKVAEGYNWCNIGDEWDNEHWIRLDPVEPIYYVNLHRENPAHYFIEISYKPFPSKKDTFSCFSAFGVDRAVRTFQMYPERKNIPYEIDKKHEAIVARKDHRRKNYEVLRL